MHRFCQHWRPRKCVQVIVGSSSSRVVGVEAELELGVEDGEWQWQWQW